MVHRAKEDFFAQGTRNTHSCIFLLQSEYAAITMTTSAPTRTVEQDFSWTIKYLKVTDACRDYSNAPKVLWGEFNFSIGKYVQYHS